MPPNLTLYRSRSDSNVYCANWTLNVSMAMNNLQNECCTLSDLCLEVLPIIFGMHLLYVALYKSVCQINVMRARA
uniref:Uncharacterized protein n=1 Tax=Anguilla anguilla TaxID=7936 RepID=A0A0E9SN98_ANGAN